MEEVRLDLGEKAYTISIGAGLLRAGLLAPLVTGGYGVSCGDG